MFLINAIYVLAVFLDPIVLTGDILISDLKLTGVFSGTLGTLFLTLTLSVKSGDPTERSNDTLFLWGIVDFFGVIFCCCLFVAYDLDELLTDEIFLEGDVVLLFGDIYILEETLSVLVFGGDIEGVGITMLVFDDAIGNILDDAIGDILDDAIGDILDDAIGDILDDAIGDILDDVIGDILDDVIGDILDDAIGDILGDDLIGDTTFEGVGDTIGDANCGGTGEPVENTDCEAIGEITLVLKDGLGGEDLGLICDGKPFGWSWYP